MLESDVRRLLARWLEGAMRERGWDQTEMAAKSGVSRDTISRIANERSGVRPGTVERLAGALGVPPPSLRPTEGQTGEVREPVASYPVSRAEMAFLEGMRELRGYEDRDEAIPPRLAMRLLVDLWNAGATPAAGDPFRRAAERARQVLPPLEGGNEGKDVG